MEPEADERLADLRARQRKKSLTPSELSVLAKMEAEKKELEEQATKIQATFRAKQGRQFAKQKQNKRDSAAATKIQSLRRAQQARRKTEAERVAKRRAFKSITGTTVLHAYEPQLYFADRFGGGDGAESSMLVPKLRLFQGDCVDVIDRRGDMVLGQQGDTQGWFPAVCVGIPVATYSKEANRLPPELSLETKSLPQIKREFARRKEREARAAQEAREEAERLEAERAARALADREREAERRATLMGGSIFEPGGRPPRLTTFFVDQKSALAAIRHERVDLRARRGASLVYRKQPWRM